MRFTPLIVLTSIFLCACSARPERFDEDQVPEGEATEKTTKAELPPLQPIKFISGEPEVSFNESLGLTQAFEVGELTVIHRVTPANDVVAARLYIMGGAANLDESTQGLEKFALDVSVSGGTNKTPRDTFTSKLNGMGSEVFSFTDRDFSGYGLKTVVANFGPTWDLMVEAAFDPAMPTEDVEVRRQQQLAEIAGLLEDPDSHVQHISSRLYFAGHPYVNLHVGTAENVAGFSREELLAYQRAMLKPERMLLVVVGNVKANDLIERIKSSFGRLPKSEEKLAEAPEFKSGPGVDIVDRQLPTNYILGYFDAPAPGSPNYPAAVVAMEYLRDRLFEEVRTKRNLTYAVSAGLASNRANYGYLYVTAADPQTTMGVIFDQVAEMKLMQIPKLELDQVVNVFLTDHYMGLETNGGQASMLARAHIMTGDWRTAEAFLANVRSVSPEDVQIFAQRYLANFRFGVVGNKATLNPKSFTP